MARFANAVQPTNAARKSHTVAIHPLVGHDGLAATVAGVPAGEATPVVMAILQRCIDEIRALGGEVLLISTDEGGLSREGQAKLEAVGRGEER